GAGAVLAGLRAAPKTKRETSPQPSLPVGAGRGETCNKPATLVDVRARTFWTGVRFSPAPLSATRGACPGRFVFVHRFHRWHGLKGLSTNDTNGTNVFIRVIRAIRGYPLHLCYLCHLWTHSLSHRDLKQRDRIAERRAVRAGSRQPSPVERQVQPDLHRVRAGR